MSSSLEIQNYANWLSYQLQGVALQELTELIDPSNLLTYTTNPQLQVLREGRSFAWQKAQQNDHRYDLVFRNAIQQRIQELQVAASLATSPIAVSSETRHSISSMLGPQILLTNPEGQVETFAGEVLGNLINLIQLEEDLSAVLSQERSRQSLSSEDIQTLLSHYPESSQPILLYPDIRAKLTGPDLHQLFQNNPNLYRPLSHYAEIRHKLEETEESYTTLDRELLELGRRDLPTFLNRLNHLTSLTQLSKRFWRTLLENSASDLLSSLIQEKNLRNHLSGQDLALMARKMIPEHFAYLMHFPDLAAKITGDELVEIAYFGHPDIFRLAVDLERVVWSCEERHILALGDCQNLAIKDIMENSFIAQRLGNLLYANSEY